MFKAHLRLKNPGTTGLRNNFLVFGFIKKREENFRIEKFLQTGKKLK